ncbi:MAG TPA: VWA domain-containing protein [Candidatus Kapabacteria bacterium]|nr:VWA domain-containing protein [Candidatus Kapabacteria bacterium]
MNSRPIPRRLLAALFLLAFAFTTARAQRQFPYQFELDSRSPDTLYSPSATLPDHRYRITAWGTYSMWEDTVNSSVDGMWIYSFPAEEWAKPEWRAFPEGPPVYVGDARLLNSHGLRIDGQPLPKAPLRDDHRYSTIIQGDGRPISATIIDWNFKNLVKRDAHDNNSGWLHVLVEELPLTTFEICGIDSSAFPTIRVAMKVRRDSVAQENFGGHVVLTENGMPVPVDRVDCSERSNAVSVAMVFDRSGSMSEPFGNSTRIAQTRDAGKHFVAKLGPADESAIYSFDDATRLDQDWTSNAVLLNRAIDGLQPGGWTAVYDAMVRSITDIQSRPSTRRKAVVVLTDGEDNRSAVTTVTEVIARARKAGVPVFTIGLLLDSDDSLRKLASETGGRYFSVRDASAMDSVFASIADIVFEKGCCSVYYTSPDPRRNGTLRNVIPSLSYDGDTTPGRLLGYHAPGVAGVLRQEEPAKAVAMEVVPNPLHGEGEVRFTMPAGGHAAADVIDAEGRRVALLFDGVLGEGEHTLAIDLHGIANGHYFVRVATAGNVSIYPLVILQ